MATGQSVHVGRERDRQTDRQIDAEKQRQRERSVPAVRKRSVALSLFVCTYGEGDRQTDRDFFLCTRDQL